MGNKQKKRGRGRENRSNSQYKYISPGRYIIIVDTKCTEKNYLKGLENNINQNRKKINLELLKVKKTKDLVKAACDFIAENLDFRDIWIVLDRDKVPNFDNLIDNAKKSNIKVAWSNPCIETWFSAYFGDILTNQDSTSLNRNFNEIFKKQTGREYKKSDKNIYQILNQFGDEQKAIERAKNKINSHLRNDDKLKPSNLIGCTTIYELVEDLNGYIE